MTVNYLIVDWITDEITDDSSTKFNTVPFQHYCELGGSSNYMDDDVYVEGLFLDYQYLYDREITLSVFHIFVSSNLLWGNNGDVR